MKQIFIENYIGKSLQHEYNLSVNQLEKETKLNLFYSRDQGLTSCLIDNGNGIELISSRNTKVLLSYCEAERFLILLTENNKTKIEFRESLTIKTI